MFGLVAATVSVMTFTYLVVLFECLLVSMMWFIFALLWFQTKCLRGSYYYSKLVVKLI